MQAMKLKFGITLQPGLHIAKLFRTFGQTGNDVVFQFLNVTTFFTALTGGATPKKRVLIV